MALSGILEVEQTMTDAEAVAVIEDLRRRTQSPAILALCDWTLALVRRQVVQAARRARRNAYQRDLMRKRRARKKVAAGYIIAR